MTDHKEKDPEQRRLTFGDLILDADEAEVDDAIRRSGYDPSDIASRAVAAAGRALAEFADGDGASPNDELTLLHRGLGVLVQLLRRRERLSEEDLAARARIDAQEIRRIEFDPSYLPSPRTVYQLEEFFGLPERSLVQLSGAVRGHSQDFCSEVVRFAARSGAIGTLNREEKKVLNQFVKFLAEHNQALEENQ